MTRDAITVARKEMIELKPTLGMKGLDFGNVGILLGLIVWGVVLPLLTPSGLINQTGPIAINPSPHIGLMFYVYFVSALAASTVMADAFAGERERHTLATLLTTPLSNGAILVGKMAASVLYSLVIVLITLALNGGLILARGGRIEILVLLAGMWLAFGVAFAYSAFGALISMRASGARQAQTALAFLHPLPIFALFALPNVNFIELLSLALFPTAESVPAVLAAGLLALMAGAIASVGARMMFVRTRMI